MQPTPEQLTRAAELAPRVEDIVSDVFYVQGDGDLWLEKPYGCFVDSLLDQRAFQAVVLALPRVAHHRAWERAVAAWSAEYEAHRVQLPLLAWLLTPAGMLAFYEALCDDGSISK